MARLFVRITPNDHPTDPKLTPSRINAGDVVCVVNDDHVFSFIELNCGHYKVIDVPGIYQGDLIHLCDIVEGDDGVQIQRRKLALDHAAELNLPELTPEVVSKTRMRDDAQITKDNAAQAGAKNIEAAKDAEIAALKNDPELKTFVELSLAAVGAITLAKPIAGKI